MRAPGSSLTEVTHRPNPSILHPSTFDQQSNLYGRNHLSPFTISSEVPVARRRRNATLARVHTASLSVQQKRRVDDGSVARVQRSEKGLSRYEVGLAESTHRGRRYTRARKCNGEQERARKRRE